MTTCKNCANTFEGKYCPNCSQKADTHRFTVKHFAHEFFHAFTHTDKGIFFLMKELFIRPGIVAREFNAGKRKKYFNPITYLLLVMALQIYLSQKTGINGYYMDQIQLQSQTEVNAGSNSDFGKTAELMKTVEQEILQHSKLINFLFLPILALFTWMLFRRAGSNYAEVLVLDVLWMAQILLMFIIICIIPFFIYPPSALVTHECLCPCCYCLYDCSIKTILSSGLACHHFKRNSYSSIVLHYHVRSYRGSCVFLFYD